MPASWRVGNSDSDAARLCLVLVLVGDILMYSVWPCDCDTFDGFGISVSTCTSSLPRAQ
jgi:hypothetical protein